MSARTKMHHTEDDFPKNVKKMGIPWREVFEEEIGEFTETGLMIRGGRHKAGLTQKELAKIIGVKTHHISEMEHGKRSVGKKMALRLAKVFGIDYRVLL